MLVEPESTDMCSYLLVVSTEEKCQRSKLSTVQFDA